MAKTKKKRAASTGAEKVVCRNKRATFDFAIEDRLEAGMVLQGSEVKSLRDGQGSLAGSYARIIKGEVWLEGANIPEYPFSHMRNHSPTRRRKLLLNGTEISKLTIRVEERGFSLIPMAMYFRGGKVKLEIGVGKGKKIHDKRHSIKQKDMQRDLDRNM
jgi:SsrA-binding protein